MIINYDKSFIYKRANDDDLAARWRHNYAVNVAYFWCFRRGTSTVADANRVLVRLFSWLYTMQEHKDWEVSKHTMDIKVTDGKVTVPRYVFLTPEDAILYLELTFL